MHVLPVADKHASLRHCHEAHDSEFQPRKTHGIDLRLDVAPHSRINVSRNALAS